MMEMAKTIGETGERRVCARPAYYRMYHPTCNEMHAVLSGYQWLLGDEVYYHRWMPKMHRGSVRVRRHRHSAYLSHGHFRGAFSFRPKSMEVVVFKIMKTLFGSPSAVTRDDEVQARGWGFDPSDKYSFTRHLEYMRTDTMVCATYSFHRCAWHPFGRFQIASTLNKNPEHFKLLA